MTDLPIVRRLAEMADHESGLSPIVKLRDEHIADVRQAAALIREMEAVLEKTFRALDERVSVQDYADALDAARAALAKAREA